MATTLNKTILKEFQATNFKSFSDGQISIEFPHEDNLTCVHVVLTPTGGLYKGGTFKFTINLPENYPESVASITCQTKIFHPNIDYSGYICFNILSGTLSQPSPLLPLSLHGLTHASPVTNR
jgi:ubiquitin-protein ligase